MLSPFYMPNTEPKRVTERTDFHETRPSFRLSDVTRRTFGTLDPTDHNPVILSNGLEACNGVRGTVLASAVLMNLKPPINTPAR